MAGSLVVVGVLSVSLAGPFAHVNAQIPANNQPAFPSTEDGRRSVAENLASGALVGAPVTATDDDNDPLTYGIDEGDSASAFAIDASTGQLRTRTSFNRELQPFHTVYVTVSDRKDADGNPDNTVDDSIKMTVLIDDVDEAGSASLSPSRPRVGQVLRARVNDLDGPVVASWQWYTSVDRSNWTAIDSAGKHDYTPRSGDQGKYLRAVATHGIPETTLEAVTESVVDGADPVPELTVSEIVTGLNIPWDLAFAPNGTMLFTERGGAISARLTDGTVQAVTADMSDLYVRAETGLMALVLDPSFPSNRRFYTCQSHTDREVQVIAWTINAGYTQATRADDPLVGDIPGALHGGHMGCRLRFGPQGYLWVATGDAALDGRDVQDLTSLAGKVLRVDAATGAGAPGNPFASSANAQKQRIYTYGHRNPQGLARRPGTSQMWSVEHGPQHDDEINLLNHGGNYGWDPAIVDPQDSLYYEDGPMTDLTRFPNAKVAKWSSGQDAIAASGGIFLEGAHWGAWAGRLAVASLADKTLRIFEFTAAGDLVSEVKAAELDDTYGRLRTPMMGPDGILYITTSNGAGNDKILKVVPKIRVEFIDGSEATRSVVEGTPAGRNIGGPVSALGVALTYTLGGPDATSFDIVSTSGQLRTRAGETYAADTQYTVTISVTDGVDDNGDPDTSVDDTITVTVLVTRTPPPPPPNGSGGPVFGPAPVAPKFAEGFGAAREVFENAQAGDPVGEPVVATHPDDLGITYSLSGADAPHFTVDEETGQIRMNEDAALEVGTTYIVNLTATDSAGFGSIIIVTIEVVEAPYHRYDLNRNGTIDRDEVIQAVSDYFAGKIERDVVIEAVKLYFADG